MGGEERREMRLGSSMDAGVMARLRDGVMVGVVSGAEYRFLIRYARDRIVSTTLVGIEKETT